jgi:hypothetical protein
LGKGYSLRWGYDEAARKAFLYGSDEEGGVIKKSYWAYEELLGTGEDGSERVLAGLVRAGVSPLNREAVTLAVQSFLQNSPLTRKVQDESKEDSERSQRMIQSASRRCVTLNDSV